jgi:hypothetical protein
LAVVIKDLLRNSLIAFLIILLFSWWIRFWLSPNLFFVKSGNNPYSHCLTPPSE